MVTFCFSYTTSDKPIVERIKDQLELSGHYVKWGLNVGQAEGTDWLNQWIKYCREADIVLNFLSPRYVKSEACSIEWNFSDKKKKGQVLNIALGGYSCVEEITDLEPEDVAPRGGMHIVTYLITGGQTFFVERDDTRIADKIVAELYRTLLKGQGSAGETKSSSVRVLFFFIF